ncbi:MAG TPA: glycosyltransferase family 2 protein, partial [Bdellovibrionales bacterium]|nr:glycosyltransferase family 2 protein [Bdellovibrionales bacterium]
MILRFRVCIPTYDNPATIAGVVRDVLNAAPFPVLVVDDGSHEPVAPILQREGLLGNRVQVLRFETNRGKGAALQAAFTDSVKNGFTHLVTVDGDGQHLASEMDCLITVAKENPWDLIIGNRKLESATVPGISKFGRKFSNFWVDYQTGFKILDSQSGFRIYPLFHVQSMTFWTRKFDFEIEVLIRLLWRGVSIREVQCRVHYPPPEERVSHFRKFRDNVRISALNTILVILSLLKSHQAPREIGVAVGLGILIGCTP